jgi:sulfotransferase family protein
VNVSDPRRLPDLVILGAMKSATTSLHRWLGEQPEVFMARPKETRFFTDKWALGPEWYSAQFADAAGDELLGESSVNYMNPDLSPAAAERMTSLIPHARLISVLRHPVDRIRSHYRHEIQRNREKRGFLEALRDPGNPYLAHSSYYTCLRPYLERFPREQLLLVRFEDLVKPPGPAWSAVLQFLGLEDRPLPDSSHNVSTDKRQRSRMMLWVFGHHRFTKNRLIGLRRVSQWPSPVRNFGRVVFTRGGSSYKRKLDRSLAPIPDDLLTDMWDDIARLEEWLGTLLWAPEVRMSSAEPTK